MEQNCLRNQLIVTFKTPIFRAGALSAAGDFFESVSACDDLPSKNSTLYAPQANFFEKYRGLWWFYLLKTSLFRRRRRFFLKSMGASGDFTF